MSTRRDTKKYQALLNNPQVAILVHDFDTNRERAEKVLESSGTCSVTVYGDLTIVTDKNVEETYRSHHMSTNPKYKQFIEGNDIAIIVIRPSYARICNINDQVSVWTPSTKS